MSKIIALYHYDKWEGLGKHPFAFMPYNEQYINRDKLTQEGVEEAKRTLNRYVDEKYTRPVIEDYYSSLAILQAKIRETERLITMLYNSKRE